MNFTSRVEIARHGFRVGDAEAGGGLRRASRRSRRATGSRSPPRACARSSSTSPRSPSRPARWRKILEQTTGALLRQSGARELGARRAEPAPSAVRSASSRRSVAAALCERDAHVVRRRRAAPPAATSTPLALQARGQLAAGRAPVGRSHSEVRLARRCVDRQVAQRVEQPRALARRRSARAAARRWLAAAAQRLERAGLGELGRRRASGASARQQLLRAGAAERVAGAQAGEALGLREGAEDEQARDGRRAARSDGVAGARRRRSRRAPRRAARRRARAARRAARRSSARRQLARRSGRSGCRARSRACAVVTAASSGVGVDARRRPGTARAPARARHQRVERVGGPGRQQLVAGAEQRARGGAEQLGGAVAERRRGSGSTPWRSASSRAQLARRARSG